LGQRGRNTKHSRSRNICAAVTRFGSVWRRRRRRRR
jgi:hypothetical protein